MPTIDPQKTQKAGISIKELLIKALQSSITATLNEEIKMEIGKYSPQQQLETLAKLIGEEQEAKETVQTIKSLSEKIMQKFNGQG